MVHLSANTLQTSFFKNEGGIWERKEQIYKRKDTFIHLIFLDQGIHEIKVKLLTTKEMAGWTPSLYLKMRQTRHSVTVLDWHRPNTPAVQTISQCFTSRLHYFSNWSQHARQAILAYQPLMNLPPFPIKGVMRVLEMQKFH